MFIDVATFGAQADACAKCLANGRAVVVTGRLVYREWDDNGTRGADRRAPGSWEANPVQRLVRGTVDCDGDDLAIPKLVKARQLLAAINNSWEIEELLRRTIHDLTVGVD